MAIVNTLAVKLEAQTRGFVQGMDKATSKVGAFAKKNRTLGDVVKNTGGAIAAANPLLVAMGVAAAATATAVVKLTIAHAKYAEGLQKTSLRLGIAVEDLSQLKFAAEQSGASIGSIVPALRTLARTASEARDGMKTYADSFDKLGVSVTGADGKLKSMKELLKDVADGLSQAENQTERLALAQEVLGRSAVDLLPLLQGGRAEIEKLTAEADTLGGTISTRFANESAEFVDNMGRMKLLVSGTKNAIAEAMLPTLDEFLTKIIKLGEDALPKLISSIDDLRFSAFKTGNAMLALAEMTVHPVEAAGKFLKAIRLTREEFDRMTTDFSEFGPRLEQTGPTIAALIEGAGAAADDKAVPALQRLNVEIGDAVHGAQTFAEALEEQIAAGEAIGPRQASQREQFIASLGEMTGGIDSVAQKWLSFIQGSTNLTRTAFKSMGKMVDGFAGGIVEAAQGGKIAFGDFFKEMLRNLAAAIIRAILLRVILGFLNIGSLGSLISSIGSSVGGAIEGMGTATGGGTPAPSGGAASGGSAAGISAFNRSAAAAPVAQPIQVRVFEATPATYIEITDQHIAPRLLERQEELGEEI